MINITLKISNFVCVFPSNQWHHLWIWELKS